MPGFLMLFYLALQNPRLYLTGGFAIWAMRLDWEIVFVFPPLTFKSRPLALPKHLPQVYPYHLLLDLL
jgi:hypothetical protein